MTHMTSVTYSEIQTESATMDTQQSRLAVGTLLKRNRRPVIRGKFLYVGDEKLWIKGVTYGTFRPTQEGSEYGTPALVEQDFAATFTLNLGLKDVELAREAAADNGVPLPTADLLRDQHLAAIAQGFGDKDWAALGEYIAQRAGL